MQNPAPATALLEVRGLRTLFDGEQGEVRAVDGIDLRLETRLAQIALERAVGDTLWP